MRDYQLQKKSRGRRRDKDIQISPPLTPPLTPPPSPPHPESPTTVSTSSIVKSLSPHSLQRKASGITRRPKSTNENIQDHEDSEGYRCDNNSMSDLSSLSSFLTRSRSQSPHALRRKSLRTPQRTKSVNNKHDCNVESSELGSSLSSFPTRSRSSSPHSLRSKLLGSKSFRTPRRTKSTKGKIQGYNNSVESDDRSYLTLE